MEPLIIGTNGWVVSIEPTTGATLWSTTLQTGKMLSSTSHQDVSVLVRGGVVFAGAAGHLFCQRRQPDAEDGAVQPESAWIAFVGHTTLLKISSSVPPASHCTVAVQR